MPVLPDLPTHRPRRSARSRADRPAVAAPGRPWPALAALALVVAAFAGTPAARADQVSALRCDGGIIDIGDSVLTVQRKCGPPAYAMRREVALEGIDRFGWVRVIGSVIVDDWLYNLGPTRFQARVLLRDGRVWRIESLDDRGF
ncbi:DUF2845 domain-containing protein [Derxia gummosa]|uniref:DUF2845 domain-containing protein n=1 Tax=Derxia gummosa DSM 723 TaxID=1121388 RepID=A0A8B6XBC2_9BURK|nr:DUF2845 domain-containing protein [Derxia gummosa]